MWTTSILPESCRLVIEETLPRGMYVDPDQLRDLSEMGKLKTYVPGRPAQHSPMKQIYRRFLNKRIQLKHL